MKKKHLLPLLLFILNANGTQGAEAMDPFSFIQDKVIASKERKASVIESESDDSDSYVTADEIKDQLQDLEIDSPISCAKLSSKGIDDEAFAELTTSLVGNPLFNGSILDLSYNSLSPKSASSIVRWLDEARVSFIVLDSNPKCSRKNVANLCKALHELNPELTDLERKTAVQNWMKRIVFLPEYYIYQASTKVKLYNQLKERHYLPDDWAENQKAYYRLIKGADFYFPEITLDKDPDIEATFDE